jgi:hypothetical protein
MLGKESYRFEYNNRSHRGKKIKYRNGDEMAHVELDIVRSESNKIELIKEYTAHGRDENEARENASTILYNFNQLNDTQLVFDEIFKLDKGQKWRAQDVKLILKIPVGQTIYMHDRMRRIIYDVKNTTNTWDGDMVGRRWLMTNSGLTCVDCEGLDEEMHKHDDYRKSRYSAMTMIIL